MWWLLFPVLGALVIGVGILALGTIQSWFAANRRLDTQYGELIRQHIHGGRVRVIGGVFDARGHETATQAWETSELDSDLKAVFGHEDRVKLRV